METGPHFAVSVIVPNYNHARYLRKRLDSILGQTYQDFELILLDDASTDESKEILQSYASDARVRIECNERNTGTPFAQWNKGVRMARGKYVWIAESDDYADPRFLERMVPLIEGNQEVMFAYCRSWDIREDGQPRGFVDVYLEPWNASHWKADFLVSGYEECRRYFVSVTPVPNASAVVFRKDAYERAGGVDERFRVSADYRMWAQMALQGKIAYTGEALNYFRTHSENARTRTEPGGLGFAEYTSVMLWIVGQVAPPGTRSKKANKLFVRPVIEMTPADRIRASIKAMSYIADWNLKYNPHVPAIAIQGHFGEVRLALYEKEFAFAPPSRWRFFRYKCEFYSFYFPVMSWKDRALGLARLIAATALGYKRRQEPARLYDRAREMVLALRERS